MAKRFTAVTFAVALAFGGTVDSGFAPMTVLAEEANLFIDGDLGDDDSDDLWNGVWNFGGDTWSVVYNNGIAYNEYAGNNTAKGLGISYQMEGTVDIYQTIDSLEAGNYTVTGTVKDTAGKAGNIKVYNGESGSGLSQELLADGITSEFQEFTYSFSLDTAVTDYHIGFQITSQTDAWVCLDSLSLTRKAEAEESQVYLADMEAGIPEEWNQVWSATPATSVIESGNGSNVWNIWSASAQTITISRSFDVTAGNYKACVETAGGNGTVEGTISVSDGTNSTSADLVINAWDDYQPVSTGYLTLPQNGTVTVTIFGNLQADGYFKMDNIMLLKVSDEEMGAGETAEKTAKLALLNELLEVCRTLDSSEYTGDSFAALELKLGEAENFYSSVAADLSVASVEEIAAMTNALQTAKDGLVYAGIVEADIYVDRLDLSEDFIKGVDISSYLAEKHSGVIYHDFAGNEVDDAGFFTLLKESGINWVRIRVWNHPYDASGNGYGGGNNDLDKAKIMGKLATDAGLKVLIDFHYSDFWADPDSQDAPKAWQDMTLAEKKNAVYDYTLESLNTLHEAGVDVRMVQVGNETNNGICGESGWSNMAVIFNAGTSAVRDYEEAAFGAGTEDGSEVLAALHFTEPNTGIQASIADNLNSNSVDYDVFATSYYPFWHGTLDNLKNVLSDIAADYGKKVMVAETSYAYTFEDGDGHENNVRADQAGSLTLNYNISKQGQADSLTDIMQTVNDTTNGIGMFYWEPAWIPVQVYDGTSENAAQILASNKAKWEQFGSGWASSFSAEYDAENAGRYYGGSSWDNQALFDYNGYPLDSLNVFKYVDTGATTTKRLDGVKTASVELEYGNPIALPNTVTGIYNDGTEAEVSVTWNTDQIAGIQGLGRFTVDGTAEGMKAVCNVEILPKNLLVNGGFENGIGEGNGWTIDYGNHDASLIKIDTKDVKKGSKALKFDAWSNTLDGVTVTQTVSGLPAGVYSCFMSTEGAGKSGSYTISLSAKGDTDAGTDTAELLGWMVWDKAQVDDIILENGGAVTVTISITTTALETWGTIDEVYLYRTGDAEDSGTEDGENSGTEDGDNTDTDDNTGSGSAGDEDSGDDSVNEEDSAENDFSEQYILDENAIKSAVVNQIAEIEKHHSAENVNVNLVSIGETKVSSEILKMIQGKKLTLAFHNGSGTAMSISGQDLKGNPDKLAEVDLTVEGNVHHIPENLVAEKGALAACQVDVKHAGSFNIPVNMHMAMGLRNVGKYANLYRYNQERKQLEYCGSFRITQTGQAMFAMGQGGNYLITVTAEKPNEKMVYSAGQYMIQQGETLSDIALRHHLTVAEIMKRNPQISNANVIQAGEKLNIF